MEDKKLNATEREVADYLVKQLLAATPEETRRIVEKLVYYLDEDFVAGLNIAYTMPYMVVLGEKE